MTAIIEQLLDFALFIFNLFNRSNLLHQSTAILCLNTINLVPSIADSKLLSDEIGDKKELL